MKIANVYDFDHTIYDGDASLDFISFCLLHNPSLWIYLPGMAWSLFLYILGLRTRKQIKQTAFSFLKEINNLDDVVEMFWKTHFKKIKPLYLDSKLDNNIIISASPKFLLIPAATRLGAHLIATNMDKKSGKITGENCRGREKVTQIQKQYPDLILNNVYGDSLSDIPLLRLAKKGFIVSGDKVLTLEEYKQPKTAKLKSPKFFRFILVGCVNATIGISIAYLFSFYVTSPQLAFTIGFTIGLIPSYFLNSVVTFNDNRFSLKKYASFVISYIPNFLIMFLFVHVFTELFGLYPLITYILAVAIAVPLTFLLLSINTFNNGGNNVKRK